MEYYRQREARKLHPEPMPGPRVTTVRAPRQTAEESKRAQETSRRNLQEALRQSMR